MDDRARMAVLIAVIEQSAPLALPAHRTTYSKLRFFQTAVAGKSRELQGSFRLPASHTYIQLVDGLLHAIRILPVHGFSTDETKPPHQST